MVESDAQEMTPVGGVQQEDQVPSGMSLAALGMSNGSRLEVCWDVEMEIVLSRKEEPIQNPDRFKL